jgi:glycosyltransferase involved in cell wall biosynthesis
MTAALSEVGAASLPPTESVVAKRQHVLYVTKRFPKVSETFILQEIREVARQGDEVTLCSLRRPLPDHPRHPGAEELVAGTIYVPASRWRSVRLLAATVATIARAPTRALPALGWALRWAVQDRHFRHLKRFTEACWLRGQVPEGIDHIHAHFGHAPATVALILARLMRRPFSFTGHANDIFVKPCPGLLKAKIAEARFVAAVAKDGQQYMVTTARAHDRKKIAVVRNGVDRSRFSPRAAEPQNGVPVVLAVGRLAPVKGLETLVDACATLAARGVEFRCELVGDGDLRLPLAGRVQGLGLEDKVRFIGALDQDGVREAHERATVFALPCRVTENGRRDGLPCAIVEAMAVGVPVVTTPVSGIPEIVRDGESGVLVPPDDPGALAEALERVISDPALRAQLVRGGREVAAGFDLVTWVARLRRLFREGVEAG